MQQTAPFTSTRSEMNRPQVSLCVPLPPTPPQCKEQNSFIYPQIRVSALKMYGYLRRMNQNALTLTNSLQLHQSDVSHHCSGYLLSYFNFP